MLLPISGGQVSSLSHLRFLALEFSPARGFGDSDLSCGTEEAVLPCLPQLRSLLLSNIHLPPTAACLTNLQLLSVRCISEYSFSALPEVLSNLSRLTCLVSGERQALGGVDDMIALHLLCNMPACVWRMPMSPTLPFRPTSFRHVPTLPTTPHPAMPWPILVCPTPTFTLSWH